MNRLRGARAGAGEPNLVPARVKLCDKMRALEMAANHLGLLKHKVEHFGGVDLVARLRAARQRGRVA
jgi:hypothetical protein